MSIIAPVTAAVPPRRLHALIAARLRWLARVVAGLVVAAWSLLLVAWLTLHWGILPHIEQWRPQIEQRASRALGVPVRIGNISVRSGGWMPSVELHGVVLHDGQARAALELPRVVAALSARSLLALELRFEQLLIDGAHLEVRRDAQGRLRIAGLDFSGAGDDAGAANWFFRQHEFVIRGGSLRWSDEQRNAPPLALTDVQLRVRNGLRHHELRLDATPPPEWGERFSVRARFTQPLWGEAGDWRRWSGLMYADLPHADVRELRRHVDLPFDLNEGNGALRVWLDVRDGQAQGATVDMALREVALRLSPRVEPLSLAQIEGRLAGQRLADSMTLTATQFGFVTGDGIRWPRSDLRLGWHQREGEAPRGGEFSAQRLDLALMAQVASHVPMGEALRKLLAQLQPQGVASNIVSRWEGALDAPAKYQLTGMLSGLSLAPHPASETGGVGRPGLHNATLSLSASERGGEAKLAIAGGALDLPGVLDGTRFPVDQLNALLQWRIEAARTAGAPPQVTLQLKDGRFANADLQGEISGQWSTGAGEGYGRGARLPGRIELNGKISHGVATRVAHYLPLGIPEVTRLYVEHAVRGGSVSNVSVRVKGDLWDFPFHELRNRKDGEFRIAAKVEDVTLAYVPSLPARGEKPAFESPWPAFTQVRGDLIFDRATMEIRNAQAQIDGVQLTKVNGGIRDLADRSVLVMEGSGRGPLADMLRFVNASPVGDWTHRALAQARGSGAAELKLALNIPLDKVNESTVKGSVALAGNDLRIRPDTPLLGAAKGRVEFSHKGFGIAGASARVLGGDASFAGGIQPDGSLRFNGQGTVSAEGLRRAPELGLLSRLAGSLSGQAAYRIGLGFVQGHAEVNLTSSLVGLASELPAPLRKPADTPLAMRFQSTLVPESLADGQLPRDTLRFELGTLLQAQYQRELSGSQPRVLRGGIGVTEAIPWPAAGVSAHINLASLNTDAWEALADGVFSSGTAAADGKARSGSIGSYTPTTLALRAQEVLVGSRRLNKLVAGISQDNGLWRASLDADQLGGYVEYRPAAHGSAEAGSARLYARLSRLSLPKSDVDGVEQLLNRPASSVPALDVVVEDFELRGKRLGRLEVEAVNRASGDARNPSHDWHLSRLAVTTPEARLSGSGHWAAASSATPGAPRRAVLDFKLDLADSGALLARLGTPNAVRGGKGSLAGQVAWHGSPLSLDYTSMTGQVNLDIASGQFLKAEPGAARLLSVLSLQSLPRRLALDFRDLFQEGFAFDNVSGDLRIEQGVAHTNNLRMRGVQAAVLMEGSADIARETQDLRVIVVPEINAGTASLAYAVINPAVGLGTFLAQVFLRKPLIEAGTREFHVTGSWADPKVERVARKLVKSAADADPSTPGAASADNPRR